MGQLQLPELLQLLDHDVFWKKAWTQLMKARQYKLDLMLAMVLNCQEAMVFSAIGNMVLEVTYRMDMWHPMVPVII